MENIKQMRKRQRKEVERLQESCKHKEVSDWVSGYYDGQIKVCKQCGRIIERQSIPLSLDATIGGDIQNAHDLVNQILILLGS